MEKNMENEMVTRQSIGVILRDEKDAALTACPAHTMGSYAGKENGNHKDYGVHIGAY